MKQDLLDFILANEEEIVDIFHKYNATDIQLFGSVAKRTEKVGSDIDFLARFSSNLDAMISL